MNEVQYFIPEMPSFSDELKRYWHSHVLGFMSETEKMVHEKGILLIKVAAGSQSFGLATETSDVDIHGVYVLNWDERIRHDAPSQIADEKNNEVYWDITKFLTELNSANPQALEMLYAPRHCVFTGWEFLQELRSKYDFLTMRCDKSFCEYARGQVDRATGLNKKVFNPKPEGTPRILDYCYVPVDNIAISVKDWLERFHSDDEYGPDQKWYSVAAIDHIDMGYAIYGQSIAERNLSDKEHEWRWAYGIVRDEEKSMELQMNSVPKNRPVLGYMFFNKNAFAKECKERAQYRDWVKNRNPERYNTTVKHGQGYDAKNLMHCVRLLLTAYGIATEHTVPVYRADRDLCNRVCMKYNRHPYSNDRDFLLAIKNGDWSFDDIIAYIGALGKEVSRAFAESGLKEKAYTPEEIDDFATEIALHYCKQI